jgi:hypothetical protein
MWPLFLIGHLICLGGKYIARLVLKDGHQKDMCCDEIELWIKIYKTPIPNSAVDKIGMLARD